MGLTADNLREGLPVSFHCLGRDVQEIHQFMKGFVNGNVEDVSLTGVRTEGDRKLMEDGTRWIVHQTANPGIFTFECDGTGRFLDGVTGNCTVGLAPSSRPPFIGTAWKVRDFPNPDLGGFAHVSLQCQGNLGDPGNPRQCPFGLSRWTHRGDRRKSRSRKKNRRTFLRNPLGASYLGKRGQGRRRCWWRSSRPRRIAGIGVM